MVLELPRASFMYILHKYKVNTHVNIIIMPFYAVANGRNTGIFLNWNDCSASVKGYKNAIYKKFDTKQEADDFIQTDDTKIRKNNGITSFFNVIDAEQNDTVKFVPDYYVYTDGACSNNGKDNALAGIGIFFGIDDVRNKSNKIKGKQTNNTAELSAIIETFYIIENDIVNCKKITIVSDSEYAIKCASSYGKKCSENNWNVDIPNKELVKTAYEMYKDKVNIQFIHIKAHTSNTDIHSIGNDQADKLANLAIGFQSCPYATSTKIYLEVPFIKRMKLKN